MTDHTIYKNFFEHREESKLRRAANRRHGKKALRKNGIAFTEHNRGAHLVVEHKGVVIDYWPGSGKWIVRVGGRQGRGIGSLLDYTKTLEAEPFRCQRHVFRRVGGHPDLRKCIECGEVDELLLL